MTEVTFFLHFKIPAVGESNLTNTSNIPLSFTILSQKYLIWRSHLNDIYYHVTQTSFLYYSYFGRNDNVIFGGYWTDVHKAL